MNQIYILVFNKNRNRIYLLFYQLFIYFRNILQHINNFHKIELINVKIILCHLFLRYTWITVCNTGNWFLVAIVFSFGLTRFHRPQSCQIVRRCYIKNILKCYLRAKRRKERFKVDKFSSYLPVRTNWLSPVNAASHTHL